MPTLEITTPTPETTPPPTPETAAATSETTAATCHNCGAPLDAGQDWCLQCGAGAPGGLRVDGPSWRSAATILAAVAILVLGAAAAAYAALTAPGPRKLAPKVITVAQTPTTPPSTTPTPGLTTPGGATTPTPGALGTPTTIKPLPSTKPPKIPLTAPTPKSSGTTPPSPTKTSPSQPGTGTKTKTGTSENAGEQPSSSPSPILLDTNAASTYNPYNFPATSFGDPSLTIDGEPTTGWTAQVEPSVAPKMAEGVAIGLNTAQTVATLTLITSTPGMTVQVYGANGQALPSSITDPAWTSLSAAKPAKHKTKIKLRHPHQAFRFILLWISAAPASAVGTPQAPGHVSVNELELFPPS